MHYCTRCGERFTRGDNLKRHQSSCKVARVGSGFLFTPSSSGTIPKRVQSNSNEESDRNEASITDESDTGEDDNDIEMDEDSEADDDEDDEQDNFWTCMHLLLEQNDDDDDDILDIFKGYLAMYTQAKNDVLYLKIIDDVNKLETNGMSYNQALINAIVKNKEAIMFKISTCEGKTSAGDEEIEIWCKFAK